MRVSLDGGEVVSVSRLGVGYGKGQGDVLYRLSDLVQVGLSKPSERVGIDLPAIQGYLQGSLTP